MLVQLLAVAIGVALAAPAKVKKSKDEELGEKLDFVERNVFNILRHGHFPALYNSSYSMIQNCGCFYSPAKIKFGSRIGLQCHRHWGADGSAPPYDSENCGPICNSPHGSDIVLWCPHGWDQDCARGCFPSDEFSNVRDRVDFWELTLSQILRHGQDYIAVSPEWMETCGCDGKMRPIIYGSKVGFECLLKKGTKPKARCSAETICLDDQKRQLVTFCPAGHRATCKGCEKVISGDPRDLINRVDWMIMVVTGYTRESLERLGWEPSPNQLLECACKGGVRPIEYGNRLGFSCEISDHKHITQQCGPNMVCQDPDGKNILHLCPDGFFPSCTQGCAYPWNIDTKAEL